jgi:LysR family transcriptional regulator, glycine cleavage system transcriptional activator
MKFRAPSINALLAFDAAARRESIVRAAEELALTESAVSKQIAALELRLGVQLFYRVRQRIYLTRAGEAYRDMVAKTIEQLERDTLEIMSYHGLGGVIEIAVLPTVGATWLIPRLLSFYEANPGVVVNFRSRNERFLFTGSNLDGALYYGEAGWPGATTDFLFHEILVPVGIPGILGTAKRLSADTIASCRLLHLATRPNAWRQWFNANETSATNALSGPRFDTQAMVIKAALSGLGVALMPAFLIAEELEQGRLAVLSPEGFQTEGAYYFATPSEKTAYPPLVTFREWLLGVARERS